MDGLATELILHIASFLPVRDALRLVNSNKHLHLLAADPNGSFWSSRLTPQIQPHTLSTESSARDYVRFLHPLDAARLRWLRKYRTTAGWQKAQDKKQRKRTLMEHCEQAFHAQMVIDSLGCGQSHWHRPMPRRRLRNLYDSSPVHVYYSPEYIHRAAKWQMDDNRDTSLVCKICGVMPVL